MRDLLHKLSTFTTHFVSFGQKRDDRIHQGDGSGNERDADGDADLLSEDESKGKRRKAEKTSRKDEEEDDVNLIEKAQREFEL